MIRLAIALGALTLMVGGEALARKSGPTWEAGRIAAGPRFTQLSLTDVETGQALEMGGMGGVMRFRASRHLAAEITLDVLAARQQAPGGSEVSRVTMPMSFSVMLFGWSGARLQPYLLAGLGMAGHAVRYEDLNQRLDFSTPLAQVGLGFEYRFEFIRLDISLRALGMSRHGDDVEVSQITPEAGLYGSRTPVGYRPRVGDRELDGGMLNIGLLWGL